MTETKKVAPRNDIKSVKIVRERPDLIGLDPNYVYQRFSLDAKNPGYVERKLNETYVGDDAIGFAVIPDGCGWEMVNRQTDPRVNQLGIRDDQGKALDSSIRHGNTVLCRMPKDVWEKTYKWADEARTELDSQRIYGGERESFGSHSVKAVVSQDESVDVKTLLEGV